MNLLKKILAHEVYPALGCTEPISCALAAATAAAQLGEPAQRLSLKTDPGTYKNGAAVTVPNSGGAKGNLIAAALGAVLARPEGKLQLLDGVTPEILAAAQALLEAGGSRNDCLDHETDFRVEVEVFGATHTARCVLAGGHTNIERIEKDGRVIVRAEAGGETATLAYRGQLAQTDLRTLLAAAGGLDDDDRTYLQQGVEMNLAMAGRGFEVGRTAAQLRRMHEDGFLADDLFYRTKLQVASAVDARMAGINQPVMTSGGSGNQGIVAILTPYNVGQEGQVEHSQIIRSIAVAHLVNAYVKCFVGELSVICGCAMAAGVAAAVAIVYQRAGVDLPKIDLAVANVIGDLGGLICDGAKPGCAMKTVTAVDAALRSGLMALKGYGLSADDGVVGHSAGDSIRNLSRITLEGMFQVDPTVLKILQEKGRHSRRLAPRDAGPSRGAR